MVPPVQRWRPGAARRRARGARRVIAALALGLAGCIAAPTSPPPPAAAAPAPLTEAERRFVLDAAAAAHYQVEAARLAELRAASPPVKAHATVVGQQHAVAVEELRLLMRGRDLAWVGGVAPDRRGVLDALAALSGTAFDRRYVEQVGVADLQRDLALVEAAARGLIDAHLRGYAERLMPMLQNHLATARALPLAADAGAAL